jgi:hypothetical protein
MRKKRLTKSEKATLERLNALQVNELMRLKSRAEMVIKTTSELIQKIDTTGIDNHYSQNSDILRYCQEVYSSSYRMGQLKAMCDDLEYEYLGKKKENVDKE